MAAFQTYDRSVLPDVRIQGPQGANAGEIIGQQLDRSGAELGSAADDLIRSAQITQQRNDAAWSGNLKPQIMLDTDAYVAKISDPASKDYIDPATGQYSSAISKYLDDYGDKVSKEAPTATSKAEMAGYVSRQKLLYLRDANSTVAKAQMAQRFQNIDASNQKSGALLVTNPARFDQITTQQEQLIRSQLGGDTAAADKEVGKMRSTMAGLAMNGAAQANPQQFLKTLATWGDKGASPADMAQSQDYAQRLIKQQQSEAKQAAREQATIYKANVNDRVGDYMSSVLNNGGVPPVVSGKPLVTEGEVLRANADDPIRGQYLVNQMRKNQYIGQQREATKHTTLEEDQATLAALAPATGGTFTSDQADEQKAVQSFIDVKWKAAQEGVKSDLQDMHDQEQDKLARQFDDMNQSAFSTGKVDDGAQELISNAYGDTAKGTEMMGKLQQSAALGSLQRQATAGDLDTDNTLYQDAATAALSGGGPGSAFAADRAKLLKQVIDDKQKALQSSPAAFVVGQSGPLKQKWDDYSADQQAAQSNPNDPDSQASATAAGRAAASATRAEQIRLGVPAYQAQDIPEPAAKQFAYDFNNAPPEQKPALAQTINGLGPSAVGQVIKAGGPTSIVAYASVTDDPVWTGQLSEAEKLLPSDVAGILKTRSVKQNTLDDEVTSQFSKLAGTIPPSSQGAYRDAVTSVAVMNIARKQSVTAAVTNAMAPFTRGVNVSGSLRIPSSYGQPDVDKGLRSVIAGIAAGTVPVKAIPSGVPGLTGDDDMEQLKRTASVGGLQWVTNENSTAAILTLPNGRFLQTPDGKRFEVLFQDAEKRGQDQPKGFIPAGKGTVPNTAVSAPPVSDSLLTLQPEGPQP